MEWVLVLLMYSADVKEPQYVDKVAVRMKGPMNRYCKKDDAGNYVLRQPTEGTDKLIVRNQCVSVKDWRGE